MHPAPRVLFARTDSIRRNHADVVEKSLRLDGFLVRDHAHVKEELYDFAVPHLLSGAGTPGRRWCGRFPARWATMEATARLGPGRETR